MPLKIRLARHGLKNTPFFHIVVQQLRSGTQRKPIEQLGTYNPIPGPDGVKSVSLNFERAKYWISVGAKPSDTVARLLAKADIIPSPPRPGTLAPVSNTKVPANAPAASSTPSTPSA